MKKYTSRIVCILLAAAIALGGVWYINRVLVMKRADGILTMQDFYAQPDGTVDVLFVGNSHSGINIDTATLWDEYGIAAYNLWGGVQPLWNSYHFIVEALKYQTPRVIVLEITAVTSDYEYSEEQNQIKNTAGMRLSKNKIEAVAASAPADRRLNLLLGFPLYHGRFAELEKKDFMHFPWSPGLENFKGSYLMYGSGSYAQESAEGITEKRAIMDKEREYLDRIISLCKEREIPLLLVKTPALEKKVSQPYYNTVAAIAQENGLNFINMNLMESELGITANDWSLDRHLNADGARKVAHWLGAYLCDEYSVTDHHGDARYASWDINAHNVNNDYLAAVTDRDDYFAELRRSGRAVLVVKNSPWEENEDFKDLTAQLESIGLPGLEFSASSNGAFLINDSVTGVNAPPDSGNEAVSFTLDGEELRVNFEFQDVVYAGSKLTWFGGSELTLIVYDTVTHSVVDTVSFSTLDGCALHRAEE